MQYRISNNDIIQVETGEIRARIIMLNVEATRFGIMYGVIDDMSEGEIMEYVDNYSEINGVFETAESAMAHAMASMQPVPTPFAADHYEAAYQQSGYARQIAGETPEMAHAHHDIIERINAVIERLKSAWERVKPNYQDTLLVILLEHKYYSFGDDYKTILDALNGRMISVISGSEDMLDITRYCGKTITVLHQED